MSPVDVEKSRWNVSSGEKPSHHDVTTRMPKFDCIYVTDHQLYQCSAIPTHLGLQMTSP